MGNNCCANRDLSFIEEGQVLPIERKRRFKTDLSRAVNKVHLHNEVLAHQQVLDFDSYKSIMGLINAYVTELTDRKNEQEFERRIELLKQGDESKATYERMIFDICLYQSHIQEALLKLAQDSLEIPDESIMVNSHDTYSTRKLLFDHMNEEIEKRADRYQQKMTKKRLGELDEKVINEAYNHFSEQLSKANQMMLDNPDQINSDNHINYIEEKSLMLEDEAFLKYGIKFQDFRAIVNRKKEHQETPIAEA
eukprot:403346014